MASCKRFFKLNKKLAFLSFVVLAGVAGVFSPLGGAECLEGVAWATWVGGTASVIEGVAGAAGGYRAFSEGHYGAGFMQATLGFIGTVQSIRIFKHARNLQKFKKLQKCQLDFEYGGRGVGPHIKLSEKEAKKLLKAMKGGRYSYGASPKDPAQYEIMYHWWGGKSKKWSHWWTTVRPKSPLDAAQARIDLAIDPSWNTMEHVVAIAVPNGYPRFSGFAAAGKGKLLGGGPQIYLPEVDTSWQISGWGW